MKRYLPSKPLPAYVFIPGVNPHPKKEKGHMEGEADPVADPIAEPAENDSLRYSLDLYNHGYFWESHVFFEALWNAHARRGPHADLLKAFIKLGAAGVKISINQPDAARGHFDRAVELFESVQDLEGDSFLGFDLANLIQEAEAAKENLSHRIVLNPSWP